MRPKKIIIAFDGSSYAVNALNFALQSSVNKEDLFVGVFIQDLNYPYLTSNFGIEPQPFEYSYQVMNQMIDEDTKDIDKNIESFTKQCRSAGVQYKVHIDKGVPAEELIQESNFADVIITGQQTYFSKFSENDERSVVNEVLVNANCPIWLIPEADAFAGIDEVVFAYDGLKSSVWAMKQFSYLYGEQLYDRKFTLLSIKAREEDDVDNEKQILEYARLHFPDINYVKRTGKVEEEIPYFIKTSANAVLVMGMQNKNFITRLFNPGHAKSLLESSNMPIFISHC